MWKPQALVLGPGGAKGFIELGALNVLDQGDFLEDVVTVVGVSIGAIIGLLWTAGFTPTQIVGDAVDIPMFKDVCSTFTDISRKVGISSNQPMKDLLSRRMLQKFGFVPTLQQLYTVTGKKFVGVTVNLDKGRVEYMSYENHPNLCCVDAVMMSMNIPLLFYQLVYQECTYVDGALGNPYPINIVDDGRTNVLGISILEQPKPAMQSVPSYIFRVMNVCQYQIKRINMERCSSLCKHLELECPFLDATGISFGSEEKAVLFLNGEHAATKFMEQLRREERIERE